MEQLKQAEFNSSLNEIVNRMSSAELMAIDGIYGILAEHLNNDVLEWWEEDNLPEED